MPVFISALRYLGVPMGFVSSPWFLVFTQLIGLLLPLGVWLAIRRENLNDFLPNMKLGMSNIIYVIAISFFIQPAMMVVSGVTSLFVSNDVSEFVVEMAVQTPLIVLLLVVAVTPSIVEEVVFRGYIQSQYKHFSIKKAAIINGIFFGIIHMNPHQFLYAFLMGVIFAYMVHYTRSIRAAVLSHFVINGGQVLLMFVSARYAEAQGVYTAAVEEIVIPFGEAYITIGEEHAMLFAIVSALFFAVFATPCAVILFRAFVSYNRARNIKYDMMQAQVLAIETEASEGNSEEGVVPETAISDVTAPEEPPGRIIDGFTIAVFVLFMLWMALNIIVERAL